MTAGTLYVTGLPSSPEDVTFRARRSLREAALVVALDAPCARQALDRLEVTAPVADLARVDDALEALRTGDVVCLTPEELACPPSAVRALVQAALASGFPVVPLPGPCLPLTAVAVSGLPADSFLYLGQLPAPPALDDLLTAVAGERRTLVAVEAAHRLPGALACLLQILGDRPLALVTAAEIGPESIWRGRLADLADKHPGAKTQRPQDVTDLPPCPPLFVPESSSCILVIGGAGDGAERWAEDRLRTEVQACLEQGLGAGEVSRQLAGESGWPRREVYRLAVRELARRGAER